MVGNMLNDLAEAIRRWTEKKIGASEHLHCVEEESSRERAFLPMNGSIKGF